MRFSSSPLRDKVDCFTTRFDFGANCPLHLSIPAYHLPVYASQCLLPHTAQDSVLDCWLSFVKAVITDRSLPCASRRNPHRSERDSLPSFGSYHPIARLSKRLCLTPWLLPSLVDQTVRPDDPTPSLHLHYRDFYTTTSWSAPVPRIGTLTLMGLPLEFLPYHRNDRFPRSPQEPGSGSGHFYAGRRPGSIQVSPGLILE